jgi:hypothetical protein
MNTRKPSAVECGNLRKNLNMSLRSVTFTATVNLLTVKKVKVFRYKPEVALGIPGD